MAYLFPNPAVAMETLAKTLPLLPLAGEVLFPRACLDLQVCEPERAALVRDCVQNDLRLGIGLIRGEESATSEQRPRLHGIVCISTIIDSQPLGCGGNGAEGDAGGFRLRVEGLERARLVEEVAHAPYRAGRLKPLADLYESLGPEQLGEPAAELRRLAEAIAANLPKREREIRRILNAGPHPSILVDQLASVLVAEPYDRQSLLETLDVGRRIHLLRIQLRTLLHRLSPGSLTRE